MMPTDEERRDLVKILELVLGGPRRDYDGARQRAFDILRGHDERVAYCGLCAARYHGADEPILIHLHADDKPCHAGCPLPDAKGRHSYMTWTTGLSDGSPANPGVDSINRDLERAMALADAAVGR